MKRSPYWPDGVPTEISGYEKTLYELLEESAANYPDKVFTIFQGATKTFAEIKDYSDRIANYLVSKGLEKGDRAAIFLPNLPLYPAIYFGILKAGGICVTCNPLYTPGELNHQLKDSGAKWVFCMDHPQFYATTLEAIKGTDIKDENVVVCSIKNWLPPIKRVLGSILKKIPKAKEYNPNNVFLDDIIKNTKPIKKFADIDPSEDPAVIIYTGGTTGLPKGAILTHTNLVFDVMALEEYVRLPHENGGPPEKLRRGGYHCYLGVLPWYHSFGMTVCMLAACGGGSRVICVPDPRAGNPPFTEVLK